MTTISLDMLKGNLDKYMLNAATGEEAITVEVGKYRAVIIDQSEWDIMCEAFAMLVGGVRLHE